MQSFGRFSRAVTKTIISVEFVRFLAFLVPVRSLRTPATACALRCVFHTCTPFYCFCRFCLLHAHRFTTHLFAHARTAFYVARLCTASGLSHQVGGWVRFTALRVRLPARVNRFLFVHVLPALHTRCVCHVWHSTIFHLHTACIFAFLHTWEVTGGLLSLTHPGDGDTFTIPIPIRLSFTSFSLFLCLLVVRL